MHALISPGATQKPQVKSKLIRLLLTDSKRLKTPKSFPFNYKDTPEKTTLLVSYRINIGLLSRAWSWI